MVARQGWPPPEIIQDLGASAWTGAHLTSGNLGKFAARVRAGEIGPAVLVVEKLDQQVSGQEPRITQRWMEDLTDCSLSIATVDGGARVRRPKPSRQPAWRPSRLFLCGRSSPTKKASRRATGFQGPDSAEHGAREGDRPEVCIVKKAPGWLIVKPDHRGFTVIEAARGDCLPRVYQMAAEEQGSKVDCAGTQRSQDTSMGVDGAAQKSTWTQETSSVALITPSFGSRGRLCAGRLEHEASRSDAVQRADRRLLPARG